VGDQTNDQPRGFGEDPKIWDIIYDQPDVNAQIHHDRLTLAGAVVDELSLPAGGRVLDIGCGAGQLSVALAQRRLRVVAVDHQLEMLERASRRLVEFGLSGQVTLAQADAARLPVADNRFDLVVALGVLPWVRDPSACVAEMVRALRPGGALLVTISNRLRLSWLLDPLQSPALALPRRQVKRLSAVLGHPLSVQRAPTANALSRREFCDLVGIHDVDHVQSQTIGFGPFTLFGRSLLGDRRSIRLHRRLQALADRGLPALSAAGAQHVVLARKRGYDAGSDRPDTPFGRPFPDIPVGQPAPPLNSAFHRGR
jgi:ubiquinone/menaquinone biosynthesis C-methylase UbiE